MKNKNKNTSTQYTVVERKMNKYKDDEKGKEKSDGGGGGGGDTITHKKNILNNNITNEQRQIRVSLCANRRTKRTNDKKRTVVTAVTT